MASVIYTPALGVPWYLDDFGGILSNPAARNVSLALSRLAAPRGLAYLTFAVEHALGLGVRGVHAVNVAIHLVNGALVYLLLRRLVPGTRLLALGGALLFAAHPLQTQAVTYAVQRMASLAATFFLASFLLFLRARRLADEGVPLGSPRHVAAYGGSLVLGLLAVQTKENTAVFPLVLLAADTLLGDRRGAPRRRALAYLAPVFLVTGALAVLRIAGQLSSASGLRLVRSYDWFLVGYAGKGEPLHEVTPLRYLVTELSVVWHYLRLVVLPWGQAIDHGYPLAASLLTVESGLAAIGLVALVALAIGARRRAPYLSLGIAVFLLGLAVESTLIPLDPMVEHRVYLPMLGVALALVEGLRRIPRRSLQGVAIAAVVVPCSVLTWTRNDLWTRPVELYERALETHPDNPRLWALLGLARRDSGDRAGALAALRKALELRPAYPAAMVDLGALYASDAQWSDAEALYRGALALEGRYAEAHRKLGLLLLQRRRKAEALEEFSAAARINPNDADSLFFEGLIAHELGDGERALRAASQLAILDPPRGARLLERIGRGR